MCDTLCTMRCWRRVGMVRTAKNAGREDFLHGAGSGFWLDGDGEEPADLTWEVSCFDV